MNKIFSNPSSKKVLKTGTAAIIILAIVLMVLPILIASSYTVPQSDDYMNAIRINGLYDSSASYLKVCFGYAGWMYKNWGGDYIDSLVQALFSALNWGSLTSLKITMVGFSLLFFIALFFFLERTLKYLFGTESCLIKLFIIAVYFFMFCSYRNYYEVFYWFVGITAYLFAFIVLFPLVTIVLRLNNQPLKGRASVAYYVIALILAFIGSGSSINITPPFIFMIMVILFFMYLRDKRITRYNISLIALLIVHYLVCFLAPGNFARKSEEGGSSLVVQLVFAAKNTLAHMYTEFYWLFHYTNFILIMLILLVCGIVLYKHLKIDLVKYTIASVLFVLLPFISAFPALFGYGINFMTNRCMFVNEVFFFIAMANLCLVCGLWIRKSLSDSECRLIYIVIALIFVCISSIHGYSIGNTSMYLTYRNIVSGEYRDYYNDIISFQNSLAERAGEEVIVSPDDYHEPLVDFANFYTENGPINNYISDYYGLESLITDYN